jgi:serine/threonine protein phosphatase 1
MNLLPLPIAAHTDKSRPIYAMGDVHGRDDLLSRLLTEIRSDAANQAPTPPPLLVLLGDYIDRGRQVPEVLERLIALKADPSFETHLLLGNHEAAMLDFLEGTASGRGWARFGGRATMEAYGVAAPLREEDDEGWASARAALNAALPDAHRELLRGMELYFAHESLLFVHAGLRPQVALTDQLRDDLLGIRGEFLDVEADYGAFIIHGHTPVEEPDLRPYRLNLDTGAYMTGRLTAARIKGDTVGFLTTA